MKAYHDYLNHILQHGTYSDDRTGTGTIATFGHEMRFNLELGFPLVSTKKVSFKNVASELMWMLNAGHRIEPLHLDNNHIWDPWAAEDGSFGPIYGWQWRAWGAAIPDEAGGIDQIAEVIRLLRNNPDSRRILVSAWNVSDLDEMALPPCHLMFQFYAGFVWDHLRFFNACRAIDLDRLEAVKASLFTGKTGEQLHMPRMTRALIDEFGDEVDLSLFKQRKLSCQMSIRSSDAFIGMPYNIAGYALLTHLIAHQVGMAVGELVINVGNAHIYRNHLQQVDEILTRKPHQLPQLRITRKPDRIEDYRLTDFEVVGYSPDGAISAPIAV